MIQFFKGVLLSDLKVNSDYKSQFIPGSVTRDFKEALQWKERIESSKTSGASKFVRKGRSCVILIEYEGELENHQEFQRKGVKEHDRKNCWMAADRVKAQINTPVSYKILCEADLDYFYSQTQNTFQLLEHQTLLKKAITTFIDDGRSNRVINILFD